MNNFIDKHITTHPKILGGKPIIKGTRISVEFILELMCSGLSFDQILKEYRNLKRSDLEATIDFTLHAIDIHHS